MAQRIVKKTPAMTAYLESMKEPETLFRDLQQHVLRKAAQPSGHRSNVIYPSEVVKSDWCMRATYLRMTRGPIAQRTSFVRENIFEEGNRTHEKWQGWLAEMGRLEGEWKCQRCLRTFYAMGPTTCEHCKSPNLKYKELRFNAFDMMLGGRCDGYCPQDKCLIEIKTMGLGGLRYEMPNFVSRYEVTTPRGVVIDLFRLWKDFKRPLPSAVKQGNLYLYLARTYANLDVNKIMYIYDFKATQETKTFMINYDPVLADKLVHQILRMANYVKTATLPDCTVNYKDGCRDCRPYEEARLAE